MELETQVQTSGGMVSREQGSNEAMKQAAVKQRSKEAKKQRSKEAKWGSAA
jgi:hypothetical protein